MDLRERVEEVLKKKYGIKNEEELKKAIEEMPEIDFGIFVTPLKERGDIKSA